MSAIESAIKELQERGLPGSIYRQKAAAAQVELEQLRADLKAETERADRAVGLHIEAQRELRWVGHTVHQAHHQGEIEACSMNTCDAARQALAKGGGA